MEGFSPKAKALLLSAVLGIAEAAGYLLTNTSLILTAILMTALAAAVSFAVFGRWRQRAPMLLASVAIQFTVLAIILIGFSSSDDSFGTKMEMSGYIFITPPAVMITAIIMRKIYIKKTCGD